MATTGGELGAVGAGVDAGAVPRRASPRWWPVVLVTLGLCALPAFASGARVDAWATTSLAELSRPAGVFTLVAGLLALDVFLPVPSSILATIGGQRLGFGGAFLAIAVGLVAGNLVGYLVGRLAGGGLLARAVGQQELARVRSLVGARPGALALAATRPVPILSEAAIVLAGAARTPPARTAAVCVLASTGLAAVYAGLGSAAQGAAALPLGLAGSVGVPVAAAGGALLVRRRRSAGAGAVAASGGVQEVLTG